MRGVWVALILLLAAIGGGVTGYALNVEYGPRPSTHPLRVESAEPVLVTVRRISYVAAAKTTAPAPRRSTPGIIDITPPEAMPASAPSVTPALPAGTAPLVSP